MNRYPKLLVGAASAIAVTLPLTIAGVALGQDQTTRQIVVEPQEKDKAAETAQKDEGEAKSETKAAAVTDEKKEEKKQEAVPAESEKAETTDDAAKTAAATDKKEAEPADAEPVKLSDHDVALALQTELKRVGCYYGSLDGIWGPQSRSALDAFGHYGKIKLDDYAPSEAWIEHVKGKAKTVCPEHYGYARPYQGTGPHYGRRPGYRHGPGYRRGPGYDGPPRGGYRRGGYDRY